VLPPGGEGEVKVTLTPAGNHETIEKRIVVVSNDPEQPRFTLTMQGKLLVDVRAKPGNLNLTQLDPGAAGQVEFGLTIRDPEATRLESITVEDQDNFELRPLEPLADGELRYELRFRGSKTVGTFSSRVEVRTSGPNTPELNIPIRATVVSNLRYSKRIQFADRDGVIAPKQLRISTRDKLRPKITKLVDPSGLLTLEIVKDDGPIVTINASVDEAKYAALDDAERRKPHTLTLHTNDPHEPRAEITYSLRGLPPLQARTARGR